MRPEPLLVNGHVGLGNPCLPQGKGRSRNAFWPYSSQNCLQKQGRPSIARVERAHSYRARSASRRTARRPFPTSETACCTSTRDQSSLPSHAFSALTHLLFAGGWPAWTSTARVQRGESATARCASTGDHQAPSPLILPSSLVFPLLEGHPCWSTCVRRLLVLTTHSQRGGCHSLYCAHRGTTALSWGLCERRD